MGVSGPDADRGPLTLAGFAALGLLKDVACAALRTLLGLASRFLGVTAFFTLPKSHFSYLLPLMIPLVTNLFRKNTGAEPVRRRREHVLRPILRTIKSVRMRIF